MAGKTLPSHLLHDGEPISALLWRCFLKRLRAAPADAERWRAAHFVQLEVERAALDGRQYAEQAQLHLETIDEHVEDAKDAAKALGEGMERVLALAPEGYVDGRPPLGASWSVEDAIEECVRVLRAIMQESA